MSLKEIIIELTTPISVSNGKGDEEEQSLLSITEPTGKEAHLASIIESEIAKATMSAIKDIDLTTAEESDNELDPDEMAEAAYVMLTTGGGDMEKVTVTFHQILKASGLIGGEKKITQPILDRMTYTDHRKCLKEYIGNFIGS